MIADKRNHLTTLITWALAFAMLVVGVVSFYMINAPVWERKAMTFDKLKPLVTKYAKQHYVTSYAQKREYQYSSRYKMNESSFYYERSDEYMHLRTDGSSKYDKTERYVMKSRPLVLMKEGDGKVEAYSTDDKTLNGGNGYRNYEENVKSFKAEADTAGVIGLFSKPKLTYIDGNYYLNETRTVKDLFTYFHKNTTAWIESTYSEDSREATIGAVVNAETNAMTSYVVKIVPQKDASNESKVIGSFYYESISLEAIRYDHITIQLKDEFKAALPKN